MAEKMDDWFSLYSRIAKAIEELGDERLLFRGHGDASWPLLPGLSRFVLDTGDLQICEQNTYFDFITRAGDLLPSNSDSWNILFTMQHHGLPTRLLDWSETFGVALYFAIREGDGDGAVWMLNPFKLNKVTINRELVIHPTDLNGSYSEYYIEKTKTLEGNAVAISPLRHNPRVFHQRAGFTLHDNLTDPLEDLHPEALVKINIPTRVRADAEMFLKFSGISEFSLFPDLDGLARELRSQTFGSFEKREFSAPATKLKPRKRPRKGKPPNPSAAPDVKRATRTRPR